MDIVYLHGIEVDCVIGVWDWEREITQRLVIDLDLGHDLTKAGESDDLADTLNYQAIADAVNHYCVDRKAKLIETLAAGIADIAFSTFNCQYCRVKVNKPGAIKGTKMVGVMIERTSS